MLEAFFNNEKTFSVFKFLLNADDWVSIATMGLSLDIPVVKMHKIINNFDLLDMIVYDKKNPLFITLDLDNPIVLSICILDELLEKYYMDSEGERMKENGNFQQVIEGMDIENMSVLDFVECLKKLNK